MDSQDPSLDRQTRQLETLDRLSERFGASLGGALSAGTKGSRELSSALDAVAASLRASLGREVGGGIGSALSGALANAARSLSGAASLGSFGGELSPFAKGGVLSGGAVTPFAKGGVVAAPTYFPLGRGLGLMGEGGAEAVMPLARGPDGRLGVRGGGGGSTTINVQIAAADVESFRRSEAQVAAALARAVARGRRGT